MKNITILLPIHKLDDDYSQMLDNFMTSINDFHNDVKLMIICPKDVKTKLEKMTLSQVMEIKLVLNNGSADFCNQINLGIEKCDTEWFSIGEIDDVYKPIWLSSMNEYIKEYSDVSVFLPIVRDVNVEGKFVSFTNESAWAYGFTEKQGFIDNEVLLDFQNYQTSGGLFKTETIKEMGMIKDNIKLTFSYELFLRLTHNGIKIMTVPRIGYQHVNFREDSLFWSYKNDDKKKLTETEVKFWLDTAKKEFFFKNKREINYEQL
jgi:hypothetical protein